MRYVHWIIVEIFYGYCAVSVLQQWCVLFNNFQHGIGLAWGDVLVAVSQHFIPSPCWCFEIEWQNLEIMLFCPLQA